jgi:hypothetical protein
VVLVLGLAMAVGGIALIVSALRSTAVARPRSRPVADPHAPPPRPDL